MKKIVITFLIATCFSLNSIHCTAHNKDVKSINQNKSFKTIEQKITNKNNEADIEKQTEKDTISEKDISNLDFALFLAILGSGAYLFF